MSNPPTAEAFGAITPFGSDSFKVGLLAAGPNNSLIVKAAATITISKWTVQNFDNSTPNVYRLFVGDGNQDYGLRVPEGNSILGLSGSPSSSDSHVWHIFRSPDGLYYYIQDLGPNKRAWKHNNGAIELAALPTGNDVNPFKFKFSF